MGASVGASWRFWWRTGQGTEASRAARPHPGVSTRRGWSRDGRGAERETGVRQGKTAL